MRILAIGDLHCKPSNLHEFQETTTRIVETASTSNLDLIVVLGDTHDGHEKIHAACLQAIAAFYTQLASIAKTMVLIGNHDIPSNNLYLAGIHHFNTLNRVPNLYIVDTPTIQDNLLFAPYVPPGRFMEAVGPYLSPPLASTTAKYIPIPLVFAHQEFRGAKLGYKPSEIGDIWPEGYPVVFSGHIHDYCHLQNNIIYVGVPRDTQFGSPVQRTLSLITLLPDNSIDHVRLDLGFPGRSHIKVALDEIPSLQIPTHTLVKLEIFGSYAALTTFKKTKEYKDLQQKVFALVTTPTDDFLPSQSIHAQKKTYLDILTQKCQSKNNQYINKIYEGLMREIKA